MTITLSNVRMLFGDVPALEIGALAIDDNVSTALVGPNGAGKSTLLLIAAGLLHPATGRVNVRGAQPGSLAARASVSFVPDQPALFDDLTVADQMTYIARLHNTEVQTTRSQRLVEALDAQELLPKFPRSMSKGQRQKAALVVGTARPFDVLLLDEPTTALDADSRTALAEAVAEFVTDGVMVVASTHDAELIHASDVEVRLVKGRLASEIESAPQP